MSYAYYNHSLREVYYKLTDLYTLFYLYFIDKKNAGPNYWKNNLMSPALNAWRGFAFDEVCFVHREKIKQALGIAAVQTEIFSKKESKRKYLAHRYFSARRERSLPFRG